MKTNWPLLQNEESLKAWADELVRLREVEDLPDFTNLNQVFLGGRTTQRVPTTPSNVLSTDNLGDVIISSDGAFEYKLVSVSGILKWARTALNTAW